MDKLCLNSQEAANALGISLPTFYELSIIRFALRIPS